MENSAQTPGPASCQNSEKKSHELQGVQGEKGGRNWKTVHADNPDKMKLPIGCYIYSLLHGHAGIWINFWVSFFKSNLKAVELKPLQCVF